MLPVSTILAKRRVLRAMVVALCASALATASAAERGSSISLLSPPFPCLSLEQAAATLSDAYAVQQQRNQLREMQDPVVGYKAGLTTVALQQRFHSTSPVFGVLFQQGERAPEVGIRLAELQNAKLETEIGFIVAEPISQPLKSVADLPRYFRYVVPTIEIPEVSFVAGCQPNAIDLVAANVAASRHLRGEAKAWKSLPDVNRLSVTLQRDGIVIASGAAAAVQPSVEASLLYLVNEALNQGHRIQAGQLFITGAMSGLIDAKPGVHVADFGALGSIRFVVQL